jgi:hypothetical protein
MILPPAERLDAVLVNHLFFEKYILLEVVVESAVSQRIAGYLGFSFTELAAVSQISKAYQRALMGNVQAERARGMRFLLTYARSMSQLNRCLRDLHIEEGRPPSSPSVRYGAELLFFKAPLLQRYDMVQQAAVQLRRSCRLKFAGSVSALLCLLGGFLIYSYGKNLDRLQVGGLVVMLLFLPALIAAGYFWKKEERAHKILNRPGLSPEP